MKIQSYLQLGLVIVIFGCKNNPKDMESQLSERPARSHSLIFHCSGSGTESLTVHEITIPELGESTYYVKLKSGKGASELHYRGFAGFFHYPNDLLQPFSNEKPKPQPDRLVFEGSYGNAIEIQLDKTRRSAVVLRYKERPATTLMECNNTISLR